VEAERGNFEASREEGQEFERIVTETLTERGGWRAALLAPALALQGDTAEALELAGQATRAANATDDALEGPTVRSWASIGLVLVGAFDRVAPELRTLASAPVAAPSVADLLLDPIYQDFRASPEFPAVLAAFEAAEAEGARLDAEEGY
jgi:hypothetical protein